MEDIIMKRLFMPVTLACLLLSPAAVTGAADLDQDVLRFVDGAPLPVFTVSDPRDPMYTNEGSDILRFCVYVETDYDTDNDGMADLVKAMVQVPRAAAEGSYQAAAIYDPTPYTAGTNDVNQFVPDLTADSFDYQILYQECQKREPVSEMSSLEASEQARPDLDWNYVNPGAGDGVTQGMRILSIYDYFLARGYAVVIASGIGTYGSEGFELCGTDLERDSHKAVVEWLAGNRRAFTDKTSGIEIRADWCNGKTAMTGCSYGGTLPYEVATTGVEGLETIIPLAGIASWYDYTNSQGVPTIFDVNYADSLAFYNCGACYLDKDWTVLNPDYAAWLCRIAGDQEKTNGNYAPIWAESDYSDDWENIRCSAMVVQGLNDFNVTTKQADLMVQAFEKAGRTVKLMLHQDGHNDLAGIDINGDLWNEIVNKWLAHYLYGADNGIEDLPNVLAQSNIDGTWQAYDSWRDFSYIDAPVSYDEPRNVVTSKGLAQIASQFLVDNNPDNSSVENRDMYYTSLDNKHAAFYPIELPENATVFGVPEIHLKLSSEITEYEGLMISAILVDTADDGSFFPAYMTKNRLRNVLPERILAETQDYPFWGRSYIREYVQDYTHEKVLSYGWTDLTNYGCGYDSSEYTETKNISPAEFYDYTLYMLPTVYTVAPGHHLSLILTTWDPYRVFLDESFVNLNPDKDSEEIDYDYSYIIDNDSIHVRMPVAP